MSGEVGRVQAESRRWGRVGPRAGVSVGSYSHRGGKVAVAGLEGAVCALEEEVG